MTRLYGWKTVSYSRKVTYGMFRIPQTKASFSIILDDSNQIIYSGLTRLNSLGLVGLPQGEDGLYTVTYFDDPSCLIIFEDIFRNFCYPIINFIGDVKTIIDIGANIGFSTAYFRFHYPEADIHAFEPDQVTCLILKENVRRLQRKCSVFPMTLYSEDLIRLNYPLATVADQSAVTNLKQADKFLRENGVNTIDILKIDSPSYELGILQKLVVDNNFGIKIIYIKFYDDITRRRIDQILPQDYVLWWSAVNESKGFLCYVLLKS
ncbi:MAG: FkbM family methyltransferase [Pseudanabaenaceae cyanobacterium]